MRWQKDFALFALMLTVLWLAVIGAIVVITEVANHVS
jgi:hypothetical protein